MNPEWIKNLTPGDEVAVLVGGFGVQYRIEHVKTITPTGIIKTTIRMNGTDIVHQFNPNGWQRGDDVPRDSLFEDIEKAKAHILRGRLYDKVARRDQLLAHASLDQLTRINVILDEIEGKKEVK